MSFVVKLTCQGTAEVPHLVRTVAQFRYDDGGWVRIFDRQKANQVIWEPSGEMRMRHIIECDKCRRRSRATSERLYPTLDQAREHGRTELLLR